MGLNMSVKKVFITIAFILFAAGLHASIEAPFRLEVRGLYLNTPFTGFNEYYSGLFSYSFTINEPGSSLKEMAGIETLACFMIVQDTVLYLRLGLDLIQNTDVLWDSYNDIDVVESEVIFNILYAGAGARQRIPVLFPGFSLFIAADAGACFTMNSSWNIKADPSVYIVNPAYALQEADFSGKVFLGVDMEAGIEWQFMDALGLSAFMGYRMAKFSITFPKTGLFADPHYDQPVEVDISGLYFGGGVKFYFNAQKYPIPLTVAAEAVTDWTEKVKTGDVFYTMKDYTNAVINYSAALKAGSPFDVYKKIAYSYFRMGDKKKAAYYTGIYLRHFPDDEPVRAWLGTIK